MKFFESLSFHKFILGQLPEKYFIFCCAILTEHYIITTAIHPFSGDLHKLDTLARVRLAKLLDPECPSQDWQELAHQVQLQTLIVPLSGLKSPTKALLDNFEVG